MAPKVPQNYFSDKWLRCNICGILVRNKKRKRGEPDVDHVYKKTVSCRAHDPANLPSVTDMARMEAEMDMYDAHLKKQAKNEQWNPNILTRNFGDAETTRITKTPKGGKTKANKK